jgi:hypothetical protein
MKITLDLPEELLHRAKVAAAERKTRLRELVHAGLDLVLRSPAHKQAREAALDRLHKGLRLGAKPLKRGKTHARR